jgi:SHS2 domain-containing protein
MSAACDRCGRVLEEGALRYLVEIQITADVAPTLDLDMTDEQVEAAILEVIDQMSATTEAEAEAQVHERLAYVLCPHCRVRWAADPLACGRIGKGAVH